MGKGKIIGLVILAVVVIAGASFVMNIVGRTAKTASQMADQTVFNADKHVYSYEEFKHKKEAFDQNVSLYEAALAQINTLKAEAKEAGEKLDKSDPIYKNAAMQLTGSSQMVRNIAKEYNAMSKIAYQKIWKGKGMPETLTAPAGM